jgi:uncharacterized surface protein with fasciclin (FAS1) repeats
LSVRRTTAALTVFSAIAVSAVGLAPAAAAAPGEDSLASVLTAEPAAFDDEASDYDILTAAVLAVLKAKPDSKVTVLTDGAVELTAFLPTDGAFGSLVESLTGTRSDTEQATFDAVTGLGIDTVETVLLYHVVPGAAVDAGAVLDSDGAALKTAAGPRVKVDVRSDTNIALIDKDRNARNAQVVLEQTDINAGNKQLAHGVDRVLRPADLPAA